MLSMNLTKVQFLLLSQVIIFLLGWPLEWTEIIVIFMPIFIPLLDNFGVDPLFFGLLVALNLQTAFLSPPVAMSLLQRGVRRMVAEEGETAQPELRPRSETRRRRLSWWGWTTAPRRPSLRRRPDGHMSWRTPSPKIVPIPFRTPPPPDNSRSWLLLLPPLKLRSTTARSPSAQRGGQGGMRKSNIRL